MAPKPKKLRDPGKLFWAWLAGFLDGDGVIGLYEAGGYKVARVRVSQVRREPLDYISKELRGGVVVTGGKTAVDNQVWQITFAAAQARWIVEKIRPYLRHPHKIEGAEEVETWEPIETPKHAISLRPELKEVIELYNSGMSAASVAAAMGMNAGTVHYWIKRYGRPRSLSEAAETRGFTGP